MKRDRNERESIASIQRESYNDEVNYTADGDDLFDVNNAERDTFELDDNDYNVSTVENQKKNNIKTKEDLGLLVRGFDDDAEKMGDRYRDSIVDKSFDEKKIMLEKVDLERLNEEEKCIERSRIQEQRKLLEEYEDDRMKLLVMERNEEDKMKFVSSVMTNELLLEENRASIEVRENEARTFRTFAKKEEHLRHKIYSDEGEIINAKKILRFSKKKARSHLFGGSRDKVYNLRWNQTPSALEVRVLMARKVNEKLPKAHYAVNVSILDGFGGNEIFFKFSKDIMKDEYKDKMQSLLKQEEGSNRIDSENKEHSSEDHKIFSEDQSDDEEKVPKRRLQSPKLVEKNMPTKLEFLKQTLKRLENDNKNDFEKSQVDFDDVSLKSFLMPDIKHKKKMNEQRHIEAEGLPGENTIKNKMISQFKQILLNFQKNFSSLQKYQDPLKDEELEFSDKIYFMIPHDSIIEPSYLIMFELILLDEKLSSSSDRVVAWGAFPLLHRGKCKVPLILGSYDRDVDKFKDIEGKYIKNIDEWVCNLYFETRNVNLIECFGHKEFMEFPIPSEIQAFLEGKLKEEDLKKLREKDIENKGEDSKSEQDEEKSVESSKEGQEGDFAKIVNGEMVNSSKNLSVESNSDNENKTQYDIENEDDIIPDLRMVDLRNYKYSIDKKLLFATDEDEELKKIRYIFKELLLDIGIGRFGLVSTFTSVVIMLCALWSRMYIHYLFQYIALKISDTPVTSVTTYAYRVDIQYGYWNVYQEVISVSSGPIGCTLIFSILILLTWIGHRFIEYFPKPIAKFVVWFGFGTMGDGFMIAIVDTALRCYTGDFYKLPNYYYLAENSSITGYIVVIVIYIFFVVVNLLLFYNYIIYLHLNGRLQDIYIRLLGDPRVFFLPNDNEISLRHLLWCYYTAIVNSQRIVVNKMDVVNEYGETKKVTTLQTSSYLNSVSLEVMRSFIRDDEGCIKELTEKEISFLNVKEFISLTQLLYKVPTRKSAEFYGKVGAEKMNIALNDIDAANPYAHKFEHMDYSHKSDEEFNRDSMPKRMNTGQTSRLKSRQKSIRSRMSSARRGSIRSKKSAKGSVKSGRSNKSSSSKKLPKGRLNRRLTMKRKGESRASLKRGVTTMSSHRSELMDNQKPKIEKIKTKKYL